MLHHHTGNRRVPALYLSGLWLEQLGFVIGSKVQIAVGGGELVVSVVEVDKGKICGLA